LEHAGNGTTWLEANFLRKEEEVELGTTANTRLVLDLGCTAFFDVDDDRLRRYEFDDGS
jgi:hypothetical protein